MEGGNSLHMMSYKAGSAEAVQKHSWQAGERTEAARTKWETQEIQQSGVNPQVFNLRYKICK